MGYIFTIGSFNTNFLNYNTSMRPKIDNVASIISGEFFDVIALQEVCRAEALAELCSKLPGNWQYDYSNPPAEKYGRGYVWNADRLRTIKTPFIRTDYHADRGHIRLKRDPYYARFTPDGLGGPAIEIRLLNLHLEPIDKLIAEQEYLTLAQEIHPKFRYYVETDDSFYMPAYTLSMGDYNLLLKKCESIFHDNGFLSVQNLSTTVSNKFSAYTTNDYDHFSYAPENLEGFGINVERVDAVNKYFNGDYSLYRDCVSDHTPIKIKLSF